MAAFLEKEMKKLVLTLGALMVTVAVQAQAQTEIMDADGNGTYSMEEIRVAFPDLDDEAFADADMNGDGEVDADELSAARDNGVIPQ